MKLRCLVVRLITTDEFGSALVDERAEALDRLAALEQLLDLFDLVAQSFIDRSVVGGIDGAYHGQLSGCGGRGQLMGQLPGRRPARFPGFGEAVDQPDPERLVGFDLAPGEHDVQRAAAPNQTWQPLGTVRRRGSGRV